MTVDELIVAAGGVTKLADIAGVDHASISASWRRSGQVPAGRVMAISDALGIPPYEIRPDLWRAPTEAA